MTILDDKRQEEEEAIDIPKEEVSLARYTLSLL